MNDPHDPLAGDPRTGDPSGRGPVARDPFSGWAAAYVLGALETDERAAFAEHLAVCARCRDEVAEFAPLPGLLARVDPAELEAAPVPDVELRIAAAAEAEMVALRRQGRRWRLAAGALAAAVLVLAFLVVRGPADTELPTTADAATTDAGEATTTDTATTDAGEATTADTATADAATGGDLLQVVTADADTATVRAEARPWGTAVSVTADGLAPADAYVLWVIDEEGAWDRAGSWSPTPDGAVRVTGASAVPADRVARVTVTDAARTHTFLEARPTT